MRHFTLALAICMILAVLRPPQTLGQTSKAQQKLQAYLKELKKLKVDTLVILKTGCVGCEMKLSNRKLLADPQTAWIITHRQGITEVKYFGSLGEQKCAKTDSIRLFDYTRVITSVLSEKDAFYETKRAEIQNAGFYPPVPNHYSYQELEVRLGTFYYTVELVNGHFDHLGFDIENERWYTATKEIINYIETLHKETP